MASDSYGKGKKKLTKIPKHARKVFSGVVFDVYQWDQEMYDGSVAVFEGLARADAVSIIPVIDDQIVIIHEEQPGRNKYTAFPAGSIEDGETPLEAAKRELYEETGMTFTDFKLIGIEDIGGYKLDWFSYRYIATGLKNRDQPLPDPGEKIEVEIVDFETAKELARGSIYMSQSIMGTVESLEELLELPEL